MENRGEGASMFPLTKGVPVQIDEEVGKMYDKYGNIFNLPDTIDEFKDATYTIGSGIKQIGGNIYDRLPNLPNIGKDVDATSMEDLSALAGLREREELEEIEKANSNIYPENVDTQHPLLAFDSSQAGRRSYIDTVPGNTIAEASGYQGRDIGGPDRLARVRRDIPTQGYGLDKKDTRTLEEINAAIVERQKAKKEKEIQDRIENLPAIPELPERRLPPTVTRTPQLDRIGMSEQIAIQQKEDAIRKAMASQEGRYDERLEGIKDERTRDQWGNVAQFFARLGTATPRMEGLSGVVDAALQAAPESLDAMKATTKEFRDRRESLEDKREDIKLISMKEDLGMTLSKQDRRLQAEAVRESKRQFDALYKIKEEEVEIARIDAKIPDDLKDVYINNLNDYSKDLIGTITNFKGKDFAIRDGKITGKRGPAILAAIESAKVDAQKELVKHGGRWDSWVESDGLKNLQDTINGILGINLTSGSGSNTAEIDS